MITKGRKEPTKIIYFELAAYETDLEETTVSFPYLHSWNLYMVSKAIKKTQRKSKTQK